MDLYLARMLQEVGTEPLFSVCKPLPVSGHLTQEDLLAPPKTHNKCPPTSPVSTPILTEKHK